MYLFSMVMESVIAEIFYFLFWISGIPYEIRTYTSDKSGADTSADVYVQLFGKDMQCTQQKSLCTKQERSGKFKKGQVDVFVVEVCRSRTSKGKITLLFVTTYYSVQRKIKHCGYLYIYFLQTITLWFRFCSINSFREYQRNAI